MFNLILIAGQFQMYVNGLGADASKLCYIPKGGVLWAAPDDTFMLFS